MATLYDNRNTPPTHSSDNATLDEKAELHNSGISEAYRFLTETVDRQLSEIKNARETTRAHSSTIEIERPVSTEKVMPKTPATYEPKREYTPYTHEKVDSDLFRAETLDRAIRNNLYREETVVPVEMPVERVEEIASVKVEDRAYLSSFAKTAIAVFCAVVTMMLTMICINTQVLNQKALQITQLEQTHNELVANNVKLRKQIEDATSEETIEEFALANGMIKVK